MLRSNIDKQLLTSYSSFHSVEKTLQKIVELFLKNERLKKLLYYTDSKALKLTSLNQEQTYSLINNQIRIVPHIDEDIDAKPYVILSLDDFYPSEGSTTFRNFLLIINILCLHDHWILEDFKLRPYVIAGEIDGLINNSHISGIGIAKFVKANSLIISPTLSGITLYYSVNTYGDDLEQNL